nr:MAG TPA: hypothetical protein [Bacteriophage sp.]
MNPLVVNGRYDNGFLSPHKNVSRKKKPRK